MENRYGFVVPLICILVAYVAAEPYQCADLRKSIPSCACEARVFKNEVINNQVVINCRNRRLTAVPPILNPSNHIIYEMTLAQNNIQTIPVAAFNGLKIQRLDLRKNRLTDINNNSFQGLEDDLKEIYLGAENGGRVAPPIGSLINLNALNTLHLEYFVFTNNGVDLGVLNLLTRLTSLTLRYNQIDFIEPLALPAALTSLTLDHQNVASFPAPGLRHLIQLESLTLTNTKVTALYNLGLEKNIRLTYLDLSDNQINTLSSGCFKGITSSLQTLTLKNNPLLTTDKLQEIKQLTALTSLYLSNISLSSVPTGASFLLNKPSLTVLHLDRNALLTLGPDVFNNLGSLVELNLAWNQFASLDDNVFTGLPALKTLDLGHQPTGQSLSLPNSLTALASLETLQLSKTTVNPSVLWSRISPMNSLQFLFLDSTSLSSIPEYAFKNLTQLRELNLNNNGLTEITQVMLAGPRGLKTLALNRNSITTISHCAFYGFFNSSPLSLELSGNPLVCDCKLRWLREDTKANRTSLTLADTCDSPSEKNGKAIISFLPEDFTCLSPQSEEPCLELYTTPAPPVTTTTPSLNLGITIDHTNTTSISVRWSLSNTMMVSHFKIWHMDLQISQHTVSQKIDAGDRSFQLSGLKPSTAYSVCVFAYISSTTDHEQACNTTRTLSDGSAEDLDSDDTSPDIGIIVGTIAGVLILLVIITAIVYLACLRKRRTKELPPQPHEFKPSELPTMTVNSRQFTKPKEKPPAKVGRALDENIKVTVISDGQTAPVSPRHSVGSYQFLDEKHPNPNPGMNPNNSIHYSNDVDDRPLPTAPNNSLGGYCNGGLDVSHNYNEIENQ